PEEPQDHHQNRTVGDQRSGYKGSLAAVENLKETPQGSESKNQADKAKAVFSGRDAGVVSSPGPGVVALPQLGVVLDEQDGEGDQQKTRAREEPLHGSGGVGVSQDDQHHHDVPQGLRPPLES